MKVRRPRRVCNSPALLSLFDRLDNTPPCRPIGFVASWLRRHHPMSVSRALLVASLHFGERETR